MAEKLRYEHRTPVEYMVAWDRCKKISFPNKATTCGVATCLAVGVYDPTNRTGYLAHLADRNEKDLIKFLKKIKKLPGLHIALAGNVPPPHEEDIFFDSAEDQLPSYVDYKTKILYILNQFGFNPENRQIHLPESSSDISYSMTVDTQTGTITVEIEPND